MNSNGMDIISLIFLGIAVLIFLYLRSILGRRTGNERTPYDPYSNENPDPANRERGARDNDNIVPMPGRNLPEDMLHDQPRVKDIAAEIGKFADADSELSKQLFKVADADESFDPSEFIKGAERAYETIIMAFSDGNKRMLKKLLARDVYSRFAEAIDDRVSKGETMSTSFVSFDDVAMTDADIDNKQAEITVRFKTSLIRTLRGEDGSIVDGHETRIDKITDLWTFARNIAVRDPNWKLIATESEA